MNNRSGGAAVPLGSSSARGVNPHSTASTSAYPSRQTPRLQNTSKSGLGNGTGWGFGLPGSSTSGAGSGFGSAALGGALSSGGSGAFGAGRSAPLSGFAQVMGGGGAGNGPIDMSDFPSLSGGGPQSTTNSSQSSWNSNVLRQQQRPAQAQHPQHPQPPPQQQPQQRVPSAAPSQHSIEQATQSPGEQGGGGGGGGSDEFPPLSGIGGPQAIGDSFAATNGLHSPEHTLQQANGQAQQTTLPFRDPHPQTGITTQQQPPIGHQQSSTVQTPSSTQTSAPISLASGSAASNVKRYADMTEKERYGLEGLAAAYEARKAIESGQPVDETLPPIMRSGIFFGQDLNALGMDLESPDPIWPTFTAFPASTSQAQGAGPGTGIFDFQDRAIIPDFTLPPAYTVTNVPPLAARLGSLSDETLFCIFYQNPRDILQEQAAQELTARDWRWHKVLRQWLQKDTHHSASSANSASGGGGGNSSLPILDLTNGAPIGVPPQRVSHGVERGVYVFFDVMNWRRERREFVLAYDELDHRFTSGIGMIGARNAAGSAPGMAMGGPVLPPARDNGVLSGTS